MNTTRKASQNRRLALLTSIVCLQLITVGCTPTLQKNLDAFKLSDLILMPNVKEALLAHAFVDGGGGSDEYEDSRIRASMKKFGLQEEEYAQQALTDHKQGTVSEWTNEMYGQIVFHPGKRYRHNNLECRKFKAVWILTGTGIHEHKKTGQACLNPTTVRWEWADYYPI